MTGPEAAKVNEVDTDIAAQSEHSNGDKSEKTNGKKKNAVWIRLSILVSILLIALIIYSTGWLKVFLNKQSILSFLESLGPLSFLGFIILQAAQVVLAPIPGEVTGLMGGYIYGPFWGVILSTVGLVTGSYVAFALSRAFGRPFVEKFVNQSVMQRFDYVLHHKGLFLVFMLFLTPCFPKDYLCFILGLGHLSTFEFLTISGVGRLMGTILVTLGGGYLRYHQYKKLYILIGIALFFFLVALVFRNKIEEYLKSWQLKNHEKRAASLNGDLPDR
ncbi:MAG: TVP38/TMEM64 family protein [Pseudomonadota bacterium]